MTSKNVHEVGMLLTYNWVLNNIENKPKTVFSEILNFNGHQAFQFGLKNIPTPSKVPLVFLIGLNLNRIGLSIEQVTVCTEKCKPTLMTRMENRASLQLFTGEPLSSISTKQQTFNFQIIMESRTDDFIFVLCDLSFQNQLWEACSKGLHNPDVAIEVDNITFKAHKAILAARSKEFATRFQESDAEGMKWLNSILSSRMFSSLEMEQFLKFVYTGLMEGPFDNDNLLLLATSFGMESLVKLCLRARKKLDFRNITNLVAKIGSTAETCPVQIILDKSGAEVIQQKDTAIVTCEWEVDYQPETFYRVISHPYYSGNYPLFIGICDRRFLEANDRSGMSHFSQSLNVVCSSQSGKEVKGVRVRYNNDPVIWSKMKLVDNVEIVAPFKIFKASFDTVLENPCLCFQLKVESQIEGLTYLMIDKKWFSQVKDFLKTKTFVDVEIISNSEKFTVGSHRIFLASRSPVFAALLSKLHENPGSAVAEINLGDVPTKILQVFLQFLYTGQLTRMSSEEDRGQLKILAEKYVVDSLKKWLSVSNTYKIDSFLLPSALAS